MTMTTHRLIVRVVAKSLLPTNIISLNFAPTAGRSWIGGLTMEMEWISVKDRLPERMQPVIVCRDNGKVEQGYRDVGDWWKVYGTRTKNVTHWMPLPEPPKEE